MNNLFKTKGLENHTLFSDPYPFTPHRECPLSQTYSAVIHWVLKNHNYKDSYDQKTSQTSPPGESVWEFNPIFQFRQINFNFAKTEPKNALSTIPLIPKNNLKTVKILKFWNQRRWNKETKKRKEKLGWKGIYSVYLLILHEFISFYKTLFVLKSWTNVLKHNKRHEYGFKSKPNNPVLPLMLYVEINYPIPLPIPHENHISSLVDYRYKILGRSSWDTWAGSRIPHPISPNCCWKMSRFFNKKGKKSLDN